MEKIEKICKKCDDDFHLIFLGLDYFPGCQLALLKYHKEKYSPVLNSFLKSSYLKSDPTVIDVDDFVVIAKGHFTPNDAYDVADITDIPFGALVNVEGVIVEKWLELSKYSSGSKTNEDPLLSHVDIELKLTSSSNSSNLKTHVTLSLYVTKWDLKANLLGLFRGVHVKFNNVIKAMSKKANVYLMTTMFSTVKIMKASSHMNPCQDEIYAQPVDFLSAFTPNKAFHCYFTLEAIIKFSMTASCGACGQVVKRGSCTFVGCHAGNKVRTDFEVKATFKVEDPTRGSALLFCDKPDLLTKMLNLSIEEWHDLENEAIQLGELVYLTNSSLSNNALFNVFCKCYPSQILCQFRCICRLLKAADQPLDDSIKLYCIHVLES